jgi:hypothetical protein
MADGLAESQWFNFVRKSYDHKSLVQREIESAGSMITVQAARYPEELERMCGLECAAAPTDAICLDTKSERRTQK